MIKKLSSYIKLKQIVAEQRRVIIEQSAELTQYRSLHGADRRTANLDSSAMKMFANLEREYKALEKDWWETRKAPQQARAALMNRLTP
jgi:hypothetical protein